MKTQTRFSTLALSLLAVSASMTSAMADSIPTIHLSGFTPNQLLTAYYGNGTPPWTQEGGGLPTIRNIYLGPVTTTISSNGTASLNPQNVAHPGIAVTNYVVLLVTDPSQSSVYFKNVDGTVPPFPGIPNPAQALNPDQFTRESIQYINLFTTQASGDGSLSINYNPVTFNIGAAVPATQ